MNACAYCERVFEKQQQLAAHYARAHATLECLRTDRARRVFLIKERGHRCEVCGNTEWQGQSIPIELDHVSGDADDNSATNLRLICPNCHALTPTYKNKNTASTSRRKRYIRNLRLPS